MNSLKLQATWTQNAMINTFKVGLGAQTDQVYFQVSNHSTQLCLQIMSLVSNTSPPNYF